MIYVIVPEGLSLDNNNIVIPSFVYRAVLNYVSNVVNNDDDVYFAPANDFGYGVSEQTVGARYYKSIVSIKVKAKVFVKDYQSNKYIGTLGNASLLKKQFPEIMNKEINLVSAYLHKDRAMYCFQKLGYKINKVHEVRYTIIDENIVSRLWYYKFPFFHKIYERMAIIRDKTIKIEGE